MLVEKKASISKIFLQLKSCLLSLVSCLSYVPKSDQLLSGSWDCTARIWSLSTQKCTQIYQGIHI